MNRFWTLVKMNIKLLLRNKGFLFFLCVTPVLSVFILNLNTTSTEKEKETENAIMELSSPSERTVYIADTTKYIVKVFDAADSELSEYVLESLVDTGMFSVCRYQTKEMTDKEVLAWAKEDAFEDRMGAILYLKKDFDLYAMKGDWKEAIQIYQVSEDERWELFEESMKNELSKIDQVAADVGNSREDLLEVLSKQKENMPKKKVVKVSEKGDVALDGEFAKCRDRIGYAFAIVILGFLFCGVCIAYTVIEEQENKVYTRIMLSKAGKYEYLLAKIVLSVGVSILQTGVIALCMKLFWNMNMGIKLSEYLFLIFMLGIIFNVLSLSVGVLVGDAMGANYAVFTIWSVSNLLAGMLFSIESSSGILKTVSYLMPQKWFLKGAELLIVGDKSAYSMIICITVAYLIVILSVGVVGLKMKRTD